MWKRGPFRLGRVPHEAGLRVLLQGVHQPSDGSVEIFVRPAQLLDLVDRMQHRGVMLAAELTANLRQRGRGELPHDVHGHLPRKSDRARIASYLEVLLAQIEVFAHASRTSRYAAIRSE